VERLPPLNDDADQRERDLDELRAIDGAECRAH
jgi:hypothetical protein